MRAFFIITALAGPRQWVRGTDDQYINWEDSTIVSLLNNVFSDANVDSLCSTVGGPDTINAMVDALTVNGTVHIPLAFTTTFLEDTINVTGVTLSGLDTFTEVNLLNATKDYYLNNHLVLAAPAAIIHARAQQKKVIGSDNYEEFTLAINLNALTLDAQIYALVSSTALGALYLDQASSIGCLQSTVEAMNVTEIAYSTESWTCRCESTPAEGSKEFICSSIAIKNACPSESMRATSPLRHDNDAIGSHRVLGEGKDAFPVGGAHAGAAAAAKEKEKNELVSLLLNALASSSPADGVSPSTPSHSYLADSQQPWLEWFTSALALGAQKLAATIGAGAGAISSARELPPLHPPRSSPLPPSPCPAHVPNPYGTPPASYLNFTAQGTLFAAISSALAQVSPVSVNAMIDCVTASGGGEEGVLEMEGDIGAPLNLSAHLGAEVQLHDLRLAGLSSFDVLRLLVPTSSSTLESRVGLRHLTLTVGMSVLDEEEDEAHSSPSSRRLSFAEAMHDPFRALFPTPADISHATTPSSTSTATSSSTTASSYFLSLNVSHVSVHAGSQVLLDLSKLSDLTLSQVTSPGCLLSAFDLLEMTQLSLLATSAMLEMAPLAPTPAPPMPAAFTSATTSPFIGSPLTPPILPDWTSGFAVDLAPLLDNLFNATNNGIGPGPLDVLGTGALVNRLVLAPRLNTANATCHNTSMRVAPIVEPPTFDDDAPDQAAAEVLEAYMTAASLGALALVVLVSCVATIRSRERHAAERRRQAEGASQELTPSIDGFSSSRFSHFASSSSFGAKKRMPPHSSSNSTDGQPMNAPLLVNEDDPSADRWHDGAMTASALQGGSFKGHNGSANYAVLNESNEDASKKQQRPSVVSFGGDDTNEEEESELVVSMGEKDVNRLWDSPKFSTNVRWGLPIACVACAALLVSANLGLGAAVFAQIELGDRQAINTPSFFDFTLQSSVQDMWDAGVYPLSMLIALLSGGWPYLKLLLIGACWTCPMQVRRRETVLQWLDALGKWSLLDSYVMVAMMVAFNFKIYLGPDQSGLPGGEAIRVTIFTVPGYGFYTFKFGTMLSLVLGHAATFLHRFAASPVARIPAGGDREALCRHSFRPSTGHPSGAGTATILSLSRTGKGSNEVVNRFHDRGASSHGDGNEEGRAPSEEMDQHRCSPQGEEEEEVQLTAIKRWGIAFLIVATFAVLIAGAVLRSYRFTFGGLVGWMLDSSLVGVGSSPRQQSYSLLSTYNVLPSAAPIPDDLGLHFIQNAFLGYALVMPLVHLVLLLWAWLVPATLRTQAFLLVIGEVANAWSAVDVFIFSLFAALLQIGQFCAFIVAVPCGSPIEALGGASLNDVIGSFFEKHDIDEDASCLTVSASLIEGCFALMVAGFSVFFTSQLVLGYAHSAVHDRLNDLLEANGTGHEETSAPKSSRMPHADSSVPILPAAPFTRGATTSSGGGAASGDYDGNAIAPETRSVLAAESTFMPLHSTPRRTGL